MKNLICLIIILSCTVALNAQSVKTSVKSTKTVAAKNTEVNVPAKKGKINWMSFEEAVEKSKKEPKKIFIDVYTDWCGWCKKMDKSTFSNAEVADYMNEHYYSVKFDAEQKEEIEFQGQTFKYVANGRRGYHELAYAILQGKMSYPTTVYMDEELTIAGIRPGFASVEDMDVLMHYFKENQHKHVPFQDFQKSFLAKKNEVGAKPVNNK